DAAEVLRLAAMSDLLAEAGLLAGKMTNAWHVLFLNCFCPGISGAGSLGEDLALFKECRSRARDSGNDRLDCRILVPPPEPGIYAQCRFFRGKLWGSQDFSCIP